MKTVGGTANNSVSKSQLFDFSGLTLSNKTKYEGVLNLIKTKPKDVKENDQDKYIDIHVWVVCKWLFKTFNGLVNHWKNSELHKKNIEDISTKRRMNEVEMEDDDD